MSSKKKSKNYTFNADRQARRKASKLIAHVVRYGHSPQTTAAFTALPSNIQREIQIPGPSGTSMLEGAGTVSARQREANPARYAKKDTRTAALRLVYGPASNRRRPNFTNQDWPLAMSRLQELLRLSGWPDSYKAEIVADMQRVNPSNQKAAA